LFYARTAVTYDLRAMSDPNALLRDAVAHHQSGRLDAARAAYEQILAANPDEPNALNLLGMVHHQQGRQDQAAALIERAIQIAPTVAGFHNNLGNVHLAGRRHAEAETSYRRALQLKPGYVEPLNNLGVALMGQGKIDDAIPLLTRAIEMKRDYPSARNNLGNALRGKRLYREAIACYRDAITLAPDHPEAWGNTAIAHLELGDHADAESAARKAIAIRSDDLGAHYTLALALEVQGRRDEAADHVRAALALRPQSAGLRFFLSSLAPDDDDARFAAAPPEFVRQLFDNYADTFDRHLVQGLNYRAPQLLFDAVTNAGVTVAPDIADLGCGTGLTGVLFKPMARTLVGVDLSSRMINQARERKIYDELHVGELTTFLSVRANNFDLAVAADVLNYFGDLRPVLAGAAQAIRVGGTMAFTLEKHEGDRDYVLERTRRFAHSIRYVRSLLRETGWAEISAREEVLRTESKQDVAGWVTVLRRG
jgi:predicted TPR repeat methyltransferase